MMQTLRSKARRFAPVALGLAFVLGLAADGFTNGGEGPSHREEQLVGPATVGTVTIVPVGDPSAPGVIVSFSGRCGPEGEVVIPFPTLPYIFNQVTPTEIIENGRLENAGAIAPRCYADLEAREGVPADLVIFNVVTFTNLGGSIEAQVVAVAAVPK